MAAEGGLRSSESEAQGGRWRQRCVVSLPSRPSRRGQGSRARPVEVGRDGPGEKRRLGLANPPAWAAKWQGDMARGQFPRKFQAWENAGIPGVFSIFIFFKNIFYRNIFLVSQFTVLYPYRPAKGQAAPLWGPGGPLLLPCRAVGTYI